MAIIEIFLDKNLKSIRKNLSGDYLGLNANADAISSDYCDDSNRIFFTKNSFHLFLQTNIFISALEIDLKPYDRKRI